MESRNPFFDSLVGKRIAGRYLVERLIGSGGMGFVAAARYPELGQKVAIKFLRPELAAEPLVSARFMREARLAAKVKSAHFVRVFDVGRLEIGVPYLVMEMLSGRDLGDELRERGPLPIADAIDLVLQASAGLSEIHAIGVVHRDIKPSNLFIANVAGSTILKVLDFGVSKEKQTESVAPLTATDHVLGTPQYMSPEQIKASKGVDARSDVWSLGVVLYELATGTLPFLSEGGGVGEMFGKILYVDPEPPSRHRSDLPAGFEAALLKCLQRDVDKRYASVLELAEAMRPFMHDSSLHWIDAIKQAASAPPVEVDDDPILEVEGAPSQRESASSDPALVLAPTAVDASAAGGARSGARQPSDPKLMAETVGKPNTGPREGRTGPGHVAEAISSPVTSMTSSSIITSPPKGVPQAGSRKLLLTVALGVVAIGGGVGFLATRGPAAASGVGLTETSATATATASATANANANANAEPIASAAASASAGFFRVVAPTASVTATAHPHPSAPVTARPTARPVVTAAPPHGSAPALILDRK